jgi:hypothetical protein
MISEELFNNADERVKSLYSEVSMLCSENKKN